MKNKISPLQFSVFLGLSSLAFVTMYRETQSCFSMIISIVISFLLLIPMLVISFKEESKIPVILKIITAVFITLISVRLVNLYSDFFSTFVNPDTPKWFISGLLLLSVFYPAMKGIEGISRAGIIASFFVIIAVILIFVCVPFSDMNNFNDNEHSFSINNGIDTLFIFSPIILSFLFYRNVDRAKIRAVTFPFIITSFIISVVMCFAKLLSISEYNYIYYVLSEISCKLIPMGFSGLFIAFSLICVFFALLYFILAVKRAVGTNTKFMSTVFLITVFVISLITMYSTDMNNILLNKYFLLALYVIIALFVPIAVIVKDKLEVGDSPKVSTPKNIRNSRNSDNTDVNLILTKNNTREADTEQEDGDTDDL